MAEALTEEEAEEGSGAAVDAGGKRHDNREKRRNYASL